MTFAGVPVVTTPGSTPPTWTRARHVALTGLALTMVGACQRILDLALDHVATASSSVCRSVRSRPWAQGGRYARRDRAGRALGYFAALTISADDPRRRLASAMAKASAGECQSLVFRNGRRCSVPWVHVGERLQFALKRAKAGELMLGGAAHHRR